MFAAIDPARIALMVASMILSLAFHEWAHAFVAKRLGDDTAERAGRLTLNPIVHIDPVGTLLLPVLGAISGFPFIGWARPTPVEPARFRRGVDRRRGMALVSAAGPLSNLLLALVAAAVIAVGGAAITGNYGAKLLFRTLLLMNVGLFIFNLLPLAPLDGSKLLPRAFDGFQRTIAPYSMLILMGMLMVPPVARVVFGVPVMFVVGLIVSVFGIRAL